jgi:hypothetical protein
MGVIVPKKKETALLFEKIAPIVRENNEGQPCKSYY